MTGSQSGGLPRRSLGRTGYEVSVFGVGGWLGVLDSRHADRVTREDAAVEAVRRAIELGVNYFDTSPAYGDPERQLGRGLCGLTPGERSGLRIATKAGTHPERRHRYDADSVRWSVEGSLQTLGVERIDVLLIHDPRSDADMDEAMGPGGGVEALEGLRAQGVIGAIGLGVRSHRFQRRAIESGRFDVVLLPYDYNPVHSSASPLIELAASRDVGVVNASPYMAGLLAGPDPAALAAMQPGLAKLGAERAAAIWRWCRSRSVDVGAVAMQYSLRNEQIAVTLAGPRTLAELEANVRHATTPLPSDLWPELDAFVATLEPGPPGGEALP